MYESNHSDGEIVEIPIIPVKSMVVFPYMTVPFFQSSMDALEKAIAGDRKIFVVCQKDPQIHTPTEEDLHEIGTIGNILQIVRLPKGSVKVLFEGRERGRRIKTDLERSSHRAQVEVLSTVENDDPELSALIKAVKDEYKNFLKKTSRSAESADKIVSGDYSPGQIADMISPLLNMDIAKQQELLSTLDSKRRLEIVYSRMLEEEEHKKIARKLKERVQDQIGKSQSEYYLNEQMKAIQKELGAEDSQEELDEFEEKAKQSGMPEEALEVVKKELKKLKMMPPTSPDANIVRNFVDWLTTVPWKAETEDNLSLDHAQQVLDEDHYGLEKVKERIIEYIAVANLVGNLRGPIICLVGPPGVGKSSLARSIARTIERNFVHMSLGGVRDEAEIRGHRRTYIGALPGKIIQSMKKAGTNNPVLLLDEIDKMTQNHMGDPASALLEVLDPEQNHEFMDHYLEVEYDLSNVMFICTANTKQGIPLPLVDRMEIIDLSGYSEFEKEKIAERHLISKQLKENGLKEDQIQFERDGVLEIIRSYTREAGVRTLERTIAKVCRKAVTQIVKEKPEKTIKIIADKVNEYLGVKPFKSTKVEGGNEVGIVNGLAWTSFGGDVMIIEVNTMKGTGKIQLTGQLGDVMKESAQAALSYVRSNANDLEIYSQVFADTDIHVHVPEGATPKDGPSAGVAIASALVSALTAIPIRKEVALTGEVTLRGKILPIGGLKEKLLAAKRENVFEVLIPSENEKDLTEIPDEIKEGMKIQTLKNVRQAIEIVLERIPRTVNDEELDDVPSEKRIDIIQGSPSGSLSQNESGISNS
ncbi:MAG: endopeptidase La [Proteobacteria bacterium]|nr:endopeptidase La [Pseudomonadota bacterium]